MKFLQDRYEIAEKINVDRVPVIRVDISEPKNGYPDCYEGDRVSLKRPGRLDVRCRVAMYGDEPGNENHDCPFLYKKIVFMPAPVEIHSGFAADDVRDMYEWNRAPQISEGQEVIVLFDDGYNIYLRVMKCGRVGSAFVFPTGRLEDID